MIALLLTLTLIPCVELTEAHDALQRADVAVEGGRAARDHLLDVELLTMPLSQWPLEDRREAARLRSFVLSLGHLRSEAAVGYNARAEDVSSWVFDLCGLPVRVDVQVPCRMDTNKNFAPTNCL
jgi:hypothetical protein